MQILKESLPSAVAGSGTVGTSEIPLTPVPLPVAKSVTIRANDANTNFILVGPSGAASDGFPLFAGEATPPIHCDSTDKVGLVAGAANQSYTYLLS